MSKTGCGSCYWMVQTNSGPSSSRWCTVSNPNTEVGHLEQHCPRWRARDNTAMRCRFRREDSVYCHAMPLSEDRLPECMGVWCKLAEA